MKQWPNLKATLLEPCSHMRYQPPPQTKMSPASVKMAGFKVATLVLILELVWENPLEDATNIHKLWTD